ncbi:hypothetical protein CI610_02565 [invertebrate metagenome]|uniref:Uncharacterized protein n=1 Tax=invertebrate metagenome TaxID=1711999 RepID=A0A2H9T5J9_9ZZZZ
MKNKPSNEGEEPPLTPKDTDRQELQDLFSFYRNFEDMLREIQHYGHGHAKHFHLLKEVAKKASYYTRNQINTIKSESKKNKK